MNNRRRPCMLLAVLLALPLVFGACSSKAPKPANPEQMNQLAQEFMLDLKNDILIYRNQPDTLADLGLVVSGQSGSLGLDSIQGFYDKYKTSQASVLTAAFYSSGPLVVIRIQFTEDGYGYYFRYELNEDEDIAVTSKQVDQIKLEVDEALEKTVLELYFNKKDIANFTFRSQQGGTTVDF